MSEAFSQSEEGDLIDRAMIRSPIRTEIKSRYANVLIKDETQFSVHYDKGKEHFSRLMVSPNSIGDQDRRIYDFYRLPLILNRAQERYNFLKLFNISKKTNMVKTLHENHMYFYQPKSKISSL